MLKQRQLSPHPSLATLRQTLLSKKFLPPGFAMSSCARVRHVRHQCRKGHPSQQQVVVARAHSMCTRQRQKYMHIIIMILGGWVGSSPAPSSKSGFVGRSLRTVTKPQTRRGSTRWVGGLIIYGVLLRTLRHARRPSCAPRCHVRPPCPIATKRAALGVAWAWVM